MAMMDEGRHLLDGHHVARAAVEHGTCEIARAGAHFEHRGAFDAPAGAHNAPA